MAALIELKASVPKMPVVVPGETVSLSLRTVSPAVMVVDASASVISAQWSLTKVLVTGVSRFSRASSAGRNFAARRAARAASWRGRTGIVGSVEKWMVAGRGIKNWGDARPGGQ